MTKGKDMDGHDFGQSMERMLFELCVYPLDGYVIFGSAVMKLHGLRDDISDIDVFVSQGSYARLRKRGHVWAERRPRAGDPPFLEATYKGTVVQTFYTWTSREPMIDVCECFDEAERVHSVMTIPLWLCGGHKAYSIELHGEHGRWAKHRTDLDIINAALAA